MTELCMLLTILLPPLVASRCKGSNILKNIEPFLKSYLNTKHFRISATCSGIVRVNTNFICHLLSSSVLF